VCSSDLLAGRAKLLLEVTDAVRAVWPAHKPLLVRLSATEWTEGGFSVEEAVEVTRMLAAHGVDLMDISSGGNVMVKIPSAPGYQVPLAKAVRAAGLPVTVAGQITGPAQARAILDAGESDAISLARVALREPSWPLRAAAELDADAMARYPDSYLRGRWPAGEPVR
jgi:2,4-dienoyl-CoA reductase-like NADH-dependent reductase (Old Yellow Enzyme family)